MKRSDIDDDHVVELARRWISAPGHPGVVEALVREGMPRNLALAKVEHLVECGRLEYGTTPLYSWPT